MTDFEDQVARALSDEAARAPDVAGLAEGARRRARVRRRRVVAAGAVATVVAVLVPLGVVASRDDPGRQQDPVDRRGEDGPRVECGGGLDWPVAVMDGGVPGLLDEAPVRAAFASLAEQMGIDAPEAIRRDGADRVPWIALAGEGSTYAVGVGQWSSVAGPARGASIVRLDRAEDGTLEASSWGDCRLDVALPAGRAPVGLKAPTGGVDSTTIDPSVLAYERGCTSGRDPTAFLGDPVIVEQADRVVVSLSSEAIDGGGSCPSNPSVPVTLDLAEPLGDRDLLDGSVWPPRPVRTSTPGWRGISVDGVAVDVPDGWVEHDVSDCRADARAYGPADLTGCGPMPLVISWTGELEVTDAVGLRRTSRGGWGGRVSAGEAVLAVEDVDSVTARRILASARPESEPEPDVSTWTSLVVGDVTVQVPGDPRVDVEQEPGMSRCAFPRPWHAQPQRNGTYRSGMCVPALVSVTAPTSALADVVASTVVESGGPSAAWQTMVESGVEIEIPGDWVERPDCDSEPSASVAWYGTSSTPCGSGPQLNVQENTTIDSFYGPGLHRCDGQPGWCGYDSSASSTTGFALVVVSRVDRTVGRRILRSLRPAAVSGWQTVEVEGVSVEVPQNWVRDPTCRGARASRPLLGVPGTSCEDGPGLVVYDDDLFDPDQGPGLRPCGGGTWCGYRTEGGGTVVYVRGVDRDTGARIIGGTGVVD